MAALQGNNPITANGNYTIGSASGGFDALCVGGYYIFSIDGTFDGATVKLQTRIGFTDSYRDIQYATWTEAGDKRIFLPPSGSIININVAGGAESTQSISVRFTRVK